MKTTSPRTPNPPGAPVRPGGWRGFHPALGRLLWLILTFALWPAIVLAQTGQTVTWSGGNTYKSWLGATNWNPQIVPLNNAGTNFTVIVPDGTSLSYDGGGARTIEALSFGNSILRVRGGHSLVVTGATVIKGLMDAQGPGSAFRATASLSVLQNYPRLWAADGATVGAAASTYTWDNNGGANTLLFAVGDGSLIELPNATSFQVGYSSGQPVYSVYARSNGVIDLRNLGQITGPGDDDWLDFQIHSGGNIRFDNLKRTSARVRFNLDLPDYSLPLLDRANDTHFILGASNILRLPALLAANNSTLQVGPAGLVQATNLLSLDAVSVHLLSNATFLATNLTAYRNSDIPMYPGRQFYSGLLTDIHGSRLSASNGVTFPVAAAAYDTPEDWRWSPTLFVADGAGSRLDLSAMTALRVRYGNHNAYTYSVLANNGGVIDWSSLQTITGPEQDDDWLKISLRNGGEVRLPSLRTLVRRTWFDVQVPQFDLPALETAEGTGFALTDGTRLNLPNLTHLGFNLSGCSFTWGFNSTVYAPKLTEFVNSELSLSPGRILLAPPFENIYASRLAVSGGSSLSVAALSYDTPEDWRWSPTLFSADGAGSVLDLSAMTSLRVRYGNYNSYTYSATANNGGVIDWSGLQTITGPEQDDDWFKLSVSNGGQIRLPNLRTVARRTWFNIQVPQFDLPLLETADDTAFTLTDGSRVNLPSLRRLGYSLSKYSGSAFNWGFNSTVEAPQLVEFLNSDLSLIPGRVLIAPAFTNIYGSRLNVSGGSRLQVAAPTYDTPEDWRWSPTLFSADGAGSVLDLSAMQTLRVRYGAYNSYTYTAIANNGGVIDWSGLQSITGPEEGDDWLALTANAGGTLKLGNVDAQRQVRITVSGAGSRLEAAGLYLRPALTLAVTGNGLLNVKGDFRYQNTTANDLVVENACVQMDGALPQRLEVGGRDSGPTGFTARNFGYSQLIVGHSNQTSVVRLVDTLNNGNRGAGGEPEALYLYGLDGQGLRVRNGSRLVLNGLNAYAAVAGQMQSLRNLIPPGSNSAAFDEGFLANFGGPRITNLTPSVTVTPTVSSVDVAFDLPIEAASFTTADVVLTGPGGTIPATSIAPMGGNVWRINFTPQSADGTYTVRVGPNINELTAHLAGLDQNGDGLSGDGANDTFTGTFVIDGTAPVVTGAFALQNGNRVGLTFNEVIVPAWATNAGNYLVNGANPSRAVLQANGYQVVLWVNPLSGDAFSLTVTGAVDALNNTASRHVTGTILAMDMRDLGTPGTNPREPGATAPFTSDAFETVAGGSDFFWNTSDAGHFDSERRSGDFDLRVQVLRVDKTPSENYAQAGLMWRESLAANSRHVFLCVTPTNGGNNHYGVLRTSTGAAGAEWAYTNPGARSGVPLPNAWLRLKREGGVFIGYRGSNGLDWTELGRVTNSVPADGYLGLATSARNNNAGQTTTAAYQNYGDISPAILAQPQNQSVASGANVTFGVTARGLPMLTYQWLYNGVPLPGETNTLLNLLAVTTNRVGDYAAVVANPYGATTSQVATLTVDGLGLGGFEADLLPAPGGNNAVTVSDWVKVGRLAAAIDTPLNSSEFARADCAPRTNAWLGTLPLGDGRLSVADWTQAGRYAAAVDPLTPAGGPTEPMAGFAGNPKSEVRNSKSAGASSVRVVGRTVALGQPAWVTVELAAAGDENALGFTLQFDPAQLRYERVLGLEGASLHVNNQSAPLGRVGVVLAKSAGQSFGAGAVPVAEVQFTPVSGTGETAVSLGDTPVFREIASTAAAVLPARFASGTVRIIEPGRISAQVRVAGGTADLLFSGQAGERYRLEASTDLNQWSLLTVATAGAEPVWVRDAAAGEFQQRFYRAVPEP